LAVLNLALQGVALARQKMVEEYEAELKKCNGTSAVRNIAKEYAHVGEPQVATEQVGISIVAEHHVATEQVGTPIVAE